MSNISYNKEQEAFELPYKMWDNMITVRFYADSEESILNSISGIAMKLETINGGKKKLARIIADDGLYEGTAETLVSHLTLDDIYVDVDIDEEEIVVCFTVSSSDGYMTPLCVELYEDEFEITSNAY